MTENQEDEKKDLNNDKPLEINRGVELLLRNRRKSQPKPKKKSAKKAHSRLKKIGKGKK